MSALTMGLILAFLFYALLLLLLVSSLLLLPKSILGHPAKSVLNWLPPFLGGNALRDWAAAASEQAATKQLSGQRTGATATSLARVMDEAAMEAMLPLAEPADRERIVACPETGQGRVGVTVPEALAIAGHIRKNKTRAEQQRIYELAVENAKIIASRAIGDGAPLPCALQGKNHVCCVFAQRPLRCRPLHAISIAKEEKRSPASPAGSPINTINTALAPDEPRHERVVLEGIEEGLTRALQSAGLDANVYELNSALATALGTPNAAERWARGEDLFHDALI